MFEINFIVCCLSDLGLYEVNYFFSNMLYGIDFVYFFKIVLFVSAFYHYSFDFTYTSIQNYNERDIDRNVYECTGTQRLP